MYLSALSLSLSLSLSIAELLTIFEILPYKTAEVKRIRYKVCVSDRGERRDGEREEREREEREREGGERERELCVSVRQQTDRCVTERERQEGERECVCVLCVCETDRQTDVVYLRDSLGLVRLPTKPKVTSN
jgi:hypothetical protein